MHQSTSQPTAPALSAAPVPAPVLDAIAHPSTDSDWMATLLGSSRQFFAAIDPETMLIQFANPRLQQYLGLAEEPAGHVLAAGIRLDSVLGGGGRLLARLLRQQLLLRALVLDYGLAEDLVPPEEPATATLQGRSESCFCQFWLRANALAVRESPDTRDSEVWSRVQGYTKADVAVLMTDSEATKALARRIKLDQYHFQGLLLFEGMDVTTTETMRRITYRLIDRESVLRPEKFAQINQWMRSLFRATTSVILSAERGQAQLLVGSAGDEFNATSYPIQALQGSCFMKAAEANRVWNVTDLTQEGHTEGERQLLAVGVRSMLLIPLVVKSTEVGEISRQLVGLVGLASDRPQHFNHLDCRRAEALVVPFTVALRQAIQQRFTRFTNIHPSVEWRFLQEAERRSWGLPPEPIIFQNVYPLYGISDIRGSSEERNRVIQEDLVQQFQLGLAVVDAVCGCQETALGEQIRFDLLDYLQKLQEKVTVDSEVSAIRYLSDRLEIYFDYFAQCGEAARQAVQAYRDACDPEHGCVYVARARYDQMIHQINTELRDTWNRWQEQMQKITRHYCDIEATDGIDHMIYAGVSIDPSFSPFHLRSLRYEQLRAMCDCARTAFTLQSSCSTKLQVAHLVLVQASTVDIFNDEKTEKLFDVKGSRDTRYEIVKKRIDKGLDTATKSRITQPGKLTLVYSTDEEFSEYQQYLRYLAREGWVESKVETGEVEPLQGVDGLRFARVAVLPDPARDLTLPPVAPETNP